MKKLAIITTHPIQYYAPIFRLLQQRNNISIKVFYTLGETTAPKHDPGFGKAVSWDIPLLDGYDFEWLENVAPTPGSHYFKGIITPGAIEQIGKYQPDALLVFGWAYQSHLKIIRHFSDKLPIYFRGDSTLLNETGGFKKILRYVFLKWVYNNITHAFYVGKNNKAYYLKYGLKENQLSFAPHAIDNERFGLKSSEEAEALRALLNIGKQDILVLYAGKFEPVKNLELLLAAFITLKKPNVHLLLTGNGPDEKKLKETAAGSDAVNIHFMDFKNQSYMPVLYQAADLFCLPSASETWGLSINEAMACGTAILASDRVGCAADLVKIGENGAVFKSGDENNLARNLEHLTKDKEQLVRLGQQSELIIKDWSFEQIALAIENKLLNEAT
ncbi:MAG: glycosyltransferase family 4 protein [Mucilaginibacter sp.]